MRAVMVKLFSPEADHFLRPPWPLQLGPSWRGSFELTGGQGDMKVDTCSEACSIDHKIPGPAKPIVEFLYIRIIEARSGCA
jgi:hypothetical protein